MAAQTTTTGEAGVEYATRLGWAVFPCHGKLPAKSKARGGSGVYDASNDPQTVFAAWREYPDANIGLACGPASGVWVLDVDGEEGAKSLAALEREHGRLPTTAWQTTGKGRHYFFALPEGVTIRNRAGILPGLDVRGEGGYVVLAPSLHPAGARYAWSESPFKISAAAAPDWLVSIVARKPHGHGPARPKHRRKIDRTALETECGYVASATQGERNDVLNRAAFVLGRKVAAGEVDRSSAEGALFDAAVTCGLAGDDGEEAVWRTIRSGLHGGVMRGTSARGSTSEGFSAAEPCPYEVTSTGIVWLKPTAHGEMGVLLTNFVAQITAEVTWDDGAVRTRYFEIEAELAGGTKRFVVSASEFSGLSWVPRKLGARALVYPGFAAKDHARAAIQTLSRNIVERTVFAHIGWRDFGGRLVYLHASGAIDADGLVTGIETDLTGTGLKSFDLPEPPRGEELHTAISASLRMLALAPLTVTAPIFAAVWRAPLGQADFSVHLAGPTGAGKSELAALAQQHFGAGMDARHLPASWSSTGNAIEVQAFAAKDALLVVDDFAPRGSANDVARLHREAARVFRAQGNNLGRGRLRPDATLRPSKAPRGLILSTGEDVPTGQSIRARTLVVEVDGSDLHFVALTAAQADARSGHHAAAMAGYVRWLAGRLDTERESFRSALASLRTDASRGSVHRRTPWIAAELGAALKCFLRFAVETGALSDNEASAMWSSWWQALLEAARVQADHQIAEDPTQRFLSLLAAAIASGRAHLGDAVRPDRPPADAGSAGWRRSRGSNGMNEPDWAPQGDQVGWVENDDLYLLPDAAYAAVQRMATAQGSALAIGQRTLWKRLVEARLAASRETGRGRNTVRRMIGDQKRVVLHLKVPALYSWESGPTGPCGPDAECIASAGTFTGADINGDGGVTAPETGPQGADHHGPRPEGPEGPISRGRWPSAKSMDDKPMVTYRGKGP